MSKVAFLYPGQGSQQVGMGKDLRESEPELYDRYLSSANDASGLPIRQLSLEGPIEELTRTDVAQPALFALSLAITEVARQTGMRPDFVAGHSLGEYTAAVASRALASEDGIALVSRRGRLMADIQSERPGAMAAVIGLEQAAVQELCDRASESGLVSLANLNSPSQTVVSGEEQAVEKLVELATEAGAKKALRLRVGAAFHSELMKPVQVSLAETMEGMSWSDPDTPLVANFSGEVVSTADAVRNALVTQIASPVRWVDCVQTLVDEGCSTFIELGPGRVLTGLVRQIAPEAELHTADSPSKLVEIGEARPELLHG